MQVAFILCVKIGFWYLASLLGSEKWTNILGHSTPSKSKIEGSFLRPHGMDESLQAGHSRTEVRPTVDAWVKRTSIGSGSCQTAANPSKVRKQNPVKTQRSKPVEVSTELKQENQESHKASLGDRQRPPLWLCREGRGSSKFPRDMVYSSHRIRIWTLYFTKPPIVCFVCFVF